ncbi:Tubulin glycylase 3A-like Protein [Tribolium castaneum]|uniref:Tubulin glycylase 3A-like Protein n=1 Tax=Tribolium castaneum TaxID=7070 RepID=A0A139WHK4_TRICA|nr:Tubulin glycylase 3A-like Protein [Tribolium castaneum]
MAGSDPRAESVNVNAPSRDRDTSGNRGIKRDHFKGADLRKVLRFLHTSDAPATSRPPYCIHVKLQPNAKGNGPNPATLVSGRILGGVDGDDVESAVLHGTRASWVHFLGTYGHPARALSGPSRLPPRAVAFPRSKSDRKHRQEIAACNCHQETRPVTGVIKSAKTCQTMVEPPEKLNQAIMVSPLVASAPSSPKHGIAPETSAEGMKRSNSCIENKYKCTITSERLSRLRKIVETAVKEHKVFTIKGGWPVIRRELLKRNWVEKYEPSVTKAKSSTAPNSDDLVSNLPVKHDWESPSAYIEKCEKTIMSRMLQNFDVDFYWSMRKDQADLLHRSNSYKLMNRFSKSLFASKEGLALLLQQHYWFSEPGVSSVNFPRCYVLGFPDHFNNFVDDFRTTACMGILKWLVQKYDTENKFGIQSPEGQVPLNTLQFAIDRCNQFIECQKHLDIDKEYPRIWDHEWEQFLANYYTVMHKNGLFDTSDVHPLTMYYIKAKNILNELGKFWPEFGMDGMRNVWILKPGNKCRGRGIQLVKTIADVEKVMNLKLKYVVQKYIEKPLLIHKTKFDIRQWFIVSNVQPLTIWMYRESYLRFSSQIFTLDNFHESLHLTNHAVQCKYTNVEQRDKALPHDNMWDCHTFQTYLKQIGAKEKWNEVILPGMREGIVCAMLASQDVMDRRQNTFEIYGADFMISEDYKPWLIEINCSPDLSPSTSVTSRMCPQCMEDIIKVVIDRRRDPTAETGLFDLIYRQTLPRVPPYLGMNLSVRGRRIFKTRHRHKTPQKERKEFDSSAQMWLNRKHEFVKAELKRSLTAPAPTNLPKLPSPGLYKGPVIEDLIDDLSKSIKSPKIVNVDVIKVPKSEPVKKKCEQKNKRERKAKRKRKH